MRNLPCRICDSGSYPYFKYADFFGAEVQIYKCINCGHGFHDRVYNKNKISLIYQESYSADYLPSGTADILYEQRQEQYKLDVSLLNELLGDYSKQEIRVLDYGCSSGGYLDAMPSIWNKSGFEVNPFHVDFIRSQKKHISIYDSEILTGEKFDLITLRGVIEHIQDHEQIIYLLRNNLNKGGYVFVSATPDFSSICATLYKSKWNQIECPEHIHQFSSASLSLLFASANLVLRSLNHPYLCTPYANLIKDGDQFLKNYAQSKATGENKQKDMFRHAFPGNMMSALYQKI